MAAHVILVRSKEAEVSAPPEPRRQCILKDLYQKCQSCKDRVEFNPRPFSESNRCKFCAVEMDHLDRQCLNTPHEPGQSLSAQTFPENSTLRLGCREVCVTEPEHLSGRYGFKAAKSINEERWPICL